MSCSATTVLSNSLTFPLEIRKSTKGNFCCCVPEAGCAATGGSVEDLLQSVQEMIADYLEDLQEDKLPFPKPQYKHPAKDEGFVSMQEVTVHLP